MLGCNSPSIGINQKQLSCNSVTTATTRGEVKTGKGNRRAEGEDKLHSKTWIGTDT